MVGIPTVSKFQLSRLPDSSAQSAFDIRNSIELYDIVET